MNGKDHGLLGAGFGLGLAPFVHHAGLPALHAASLAELAVLSAGAGLIPDFDHHNASPAYALPFGRLIAGGVRWRLPVPRSWTGRTLIPGIEQLSGGHRQATHSLAFTAGALAGMWWVAGRHGWTRLAVLFVLLALVFHLIWHKEVRDLAMAAGATAMIVHWAPPGRWLAVAVTLGVASHICGDMLNPQRCPLLWPGPWRFGLPLFRCAGRGERIFSAGMVAGLGWLAWVRL